MAGFKKNPSKHENMYEGRFNAEQIEYDKRGGCYVNVGEIKGVGKVQPVGTFDHSAAGGVPMGRIETMKLPVSRG
jgi:hypothetical protein